MVKNFLVRLIAYPFCVFLIISCYAMVFETPNYSNPIYVTRAKFFGAIGVFVPITYLVSDIVYQIKSLRKKD